MKDQKAKIINYHDMKNKLVYFVCFGAMLAILTSVYYICFFREIRVDLTQNLTITFVGENGNGSIQTKRHDYNYNQRIEPFYESLSEELSANGSLSNGDEVEIAVKYNEDLAKQLHIVVTQNTMTFTVQGLSQRYESKVDISNEYMDMLMKESSAYLKKDIDRILREDFTFEKNAQYKEEQLIQRVFLKADNVEEHDRIIFVYKITAQGETTNNGLQDDTIYYMVVFDDVNDNLDLKDNQVYGEKALNTQEDLTSTEGIVRYFKSKYVLSYDVEVF